MASQNVAIQIKVYDRLQKFIENWNNMYPDKIDRLNSNSQAIDYLLDNIEGK